jgi:hypothetical protein
MLIRPQRLEPIRVLLKDAACCRAITHVATNNRLAPELPQDKVKAVKADSIAYADPVLIIIRQSSFGNLSSQTLLWTRDRERVPFCINQPLRIQSCNNLLQKEPWQFWFGRYRHWRLHSFRECNHALLGRLTYYDSTKWGLPPTCD